MTQIYVTKARSLWEEEARKAGVIINGEFIADGQKHRLATTDKPHHKNVEYRVMDWGNNILALSLIDYSDPERSLHFQTGQPRKNTKNAAQIAEMKEKDEKERREHRQAARERDQQACVEAKPATDANAYLTKKGVHAVEGLLQGREGELIVPLKDIYDQHCGSQRISPDGSKTFAKDCGTQGAFFEIRGINDTIFFVEGLATGLSAHEATGNTVFVCCGANNLEPVAVAVSTKFPERRYAFLADNDLDNNAGNIGIKKAREAASKIGAAVIYPEAIGGKATDWNDVHTMLGLREVTRQISHSSGRSQIAKTPDGFFFRESGERPGIYLYGRDRMPPRWIAAPLYVTALTRTEDSNNWSKLVTWKDPDGVQHEKLLHHEDLVRDPATTLSKLDGWIFNVNHKSDIMHYLSTIVPQDRLLLVEQTGWTSNLSAYVLPNKTFYAEPPAEEIKLARPATEQTYGVKGTFEAWKELMKLTIGNHNLTLGLTSAFTGPLLKLAKMEFLCFQFTGRSSCGKTTILKTAASVCANYEQYIQSWRATDNGLEGVCRQRNDGLLILDEQSESDCKIIQETSYMIANGQGKRRARTDGEARAISRWTLTALSSGEVSINERTMEGGRTPHAGQEVRWINMPVEYEDIRELHGTGSPHELVDQLKSGCLEHYGHAWDLFLAQLVSDAEELVPQLHSDIDAFSKELLAGLEGCSGQVLRVADRFALCAVTGRLASRWNILPHSEEDVDASIKACFAKWIENREGTESSEELIAERRLLAFIHQHENRFETGSDDHLIQNRAGYYLRDESDDRYKVYGVLPHIMSELLGGLPDQKPKLTTLRALKTKELLMQRTAHGKPRFLLNCPTPSGTRADLYLVRIPRCSSSEQDDARFGTKSFCKQHVAASEAQVADHDLYVDFNF